LHNRRFSRCIWSPGGYDLIIYMIARSMDHLKEIARTAFSDSDEISSYEASIAYDARWDLSVPTMETDESE